MELLKAIPGTYDIFPEQAETWDRLRRCVERLMTVYAYGRIETPHLESAQLFARSVGSETDIVQKEMYVFEDRGGRELALRPEGTAGVVRAFIEARLDRQRPYHKLWYWGPMFRAERPQKGRYRQFWQFGAEAIGVAGPDVDVEQIALAMHIAREWGAGDSVLRLNSIGDAVCRPEYRARLSAFLESVAHRLCVNCKRRMARNPLRVLDCKEPECQAATQEAPLTLDHLCDPCREHLEGVRAGLDRLDLPYRMDGRIVRGLDYYQRTAFELENPRLGSQSSLLGGGRYDGLLLTLGGPDLPGVGWAAGVERFLLVGQSGVPEAGIDLYVAAFPETRASAQELTARLRLGGLRVETDLLVRSLKAQLKEASRLHARFAVLVGPDEWQRQVVTLRDLGTGSQEELPVAALPRRVLPR